MSKMAQPATGAGTQFDGLQSVALLPGRPRRHDHDDGTVPLLLAGPNAPGEFQIGRQVGNNERRPKRREERHADAATFGGPPTARNAERAQFLATRSTCPPLGSSCRNVPWQLVSARETAAVAQRQRCQWASLPKKTTNTVLTMIEKSSQTLQLLMYQRSSSTRRRILSSVSVSPRAPETCAQPVIPDLTWWRKAYFSIVEVK